MQTSSARAACDLSICVATSGTACTIGGGTYTIDSGCFLDYPTTDVTIDRSVTLQTAKVGDSYTLRGKTLTVKGTLQAQGGTLFLLTTAGSLKLVNAQNSGRLDVRQGGKLIIVSAADVSLQGDEITADGMSQLSGGTITVVGTDVTVTSPTHANGTGGDGGYIEITASGNVTIGGDLSVTGSNVSAPAAGGSISIKAGGTLKITKDLVAFGGHDGDGGVVELITSDAATLSGGIHVDGEGGTGLANGGKILVQAGSANILGVWSATGNAAAEGGDVVVRALTGAITTATSNSISADGGTTDGGHGGSVELEAKTDATIRGPIHANGGDADSTGGTIAIRATGTLNVSSTIEAISSPNGGARNGSITLGPACNVTISSHVNTRTDSGGCDTTAAAGGNTIIYGKTLTLSGSSLQADSVASNTGGNTVLCACLDADADGVCDTPSACAQGFSQTGATINPTPVIDQTLPASCP